VISSGSNGCPIPYWKDFGGSAARVSDPVTRRPSGLLAARRPSGLVLPVGIPVPWQAFYRPSVICGAGWGWGSCPHCVAALAAPRPVPSPRRPQSGRGRA
jgi:hypothetical protein